MVTRHGNDNRLKQQLLEATMPRTQLKAKARSLARRQKALEMLVDGHTIASISRTLQMSNFGVQKLLRRALASESLFPNTLGPERIGELRQLQGERLTGLWQKVQVALDELQPRLGSKTERNMDAVAFARLVEAATRVSERLANLFGLNVPQKTVIETFSVNLQRTEKTVTITFDAAALEPPKDPIPGLSIWRDGRLVEGPGDGLNVAANASVGPEPGFEPLGALWHQNGEQTAS